MESLKCLEPVSLWSDAEICAVQIVNHFNRDAKMLLTAIGSTLLGLTVLILISIPFFGRKEAGIERIDEMSQLAELRSLYDVAQTEIETLELEYQLRYVSEIDYQRRIVQYRTTREQLFSQLQLLGSDVADSENNNS